MNHDQETVLITGANRGLGLEMARQLVARGSNVLACARQPTEATELLELARSHSGQISIYELDVTDGKSVSRARSTIGGRQIDILINNAGVIGPARQSVNDMDFDGWAYTLAVNTLGPMRVLQAFLDNLRAAEHPRVLNLTSFMGSFATQGSNHIAYRSSKAALNRAMRAAAAELAGDGISIAMVHPGWARTAMGGASATLPAEDSVRGLIALVDGLDVEKSGRLFNWDGKEYDW
jgi:NAD(P)-dependent dehydrogenase (short-subunit alcohol dehydrogenase family)